MQKVPSDFPHFLIIVVFLLSACQSNPTIMTTRKTEPSPVSSPTPTRPLIPASPTPQSAAVAPTSEHPIEAFWKDFYTPDFSAVHLPLDDIPNEFLIFGNLPISPPAYDLPPGLVSFLGRWEGLEFGSYGETGTRLVLLVTSISPQRGTAYLWAGTDLQYPFYVKEIHFRVIPGDEPAIEWQADLTGSPEGKGLQGVISIVHEQETDQLVGSVRVPPSQQVVRTIQLAHGEAYRYYSNYRGYLESQHISFHEFDNDAQRRVGWGYALYLPEGYETGMQKDWPLLVFLIGTGERGHSLSLLTKHGPLRTVLDGGRLPFIIASPMLEISSDFRSFPEAHLDALMDELLADYRVDSQRIYLTGLSMGGEATYRYALHRPDLFAALAPLAAFDPKYLPGSTLEGFKPFTLPWERIAKIPVWTVHGTQDPIVPLFAAQQTVDALRKAGGQVQFDVIDGGGHNIWTDIYTDQAFYNWLLAQSKP